MSTTVTVDDLFVVYTLTELNSARVAEEPLQLPCEPENGLELTALKDGNRFLARSLDYYNDVKVCAIRWRKNLYYFMYCDDPNVKNFASKFEDGEGITSYIQVFDFESQVIASLFNIIGEASTSVSINGKAELLFLGYIVGWKLQSEVWPMLVNKALHYGIRCPRGLQTDPLKRYTTVEKLYDLANIYSQGANFHRRLPSLADALKYWGKYLYHEETWPPPDKILNAVCTQPALAARMIEPYLHGMANTALEYSS